jgi:hypothetical protein
MKDGSAVGSTARAAYLKAMTVAILENRSVLFVAGADAVAFLQGLLTHDVALLAPGRPIYAGLLSPQGKTLFDMILHAGDDGAILIDVAASRAEALARRLSMYRLRKAVTITPTDLAVHVAWGDDASAHPADPRTPALGARWVAAPSAQRSTTLGAVAWDAHRHDMGVPDSDDIGQDELLWLETGADLLGGVSFTKGCYVGQENTARMHHRDKVRRRLVPITISGDPGDATDITDATGRSCGRLRSRRGDHAIAHLRMEAASGPLQLGSAAVTVRRPDWLKAALADSEA